MKKNQNINLSKLAHNLSESAAYQHRCQHLINSRHFKGWDSFFIKTIAQQAEKLTEIEAKFQQDSL